MKAKEAEESREKRDDPPEGPLEINQEAPPKGKRIVDATCTPADIKYPTDLNLLNEAREKTESIIDRMHSQRTKPTKKPRTYRQKAGKAYLLVSKARQPGRKKMRRGISKQLG